MRIEHFVDERGNFIYRAEFEGSFLSKDEVKALGKHVSGVLDENAKLRELVRDIWSELDAATQYDAGGGRGIVGEFAARMRELGVEL